ncbi:MAG: MlaD family protein [Salibacteraceae bacterium]
MEISREVKVGLTVVVSLLLFYFGYNYLKGSKVFKSGYFVHAQYSNINGLGVDDPILVQGFNIGKVNSTSFNSTTGKILVELHILNEDLSIPNNSTAVIVSSSLLGGKEIHINMGKSEVFLEDGDTIKSDTEGDLLSSLSSSLEPFEKSAMDAVNSIDSVMKLLQGVLNEKNRQAIDQGLTDLSGTLNNLNGASADLESLIATEKSRLSGIITNLDKMSSNLSSFSDTLGGLEIKKTINEANAALLSANAILEKVENGEGSIGQLVNNDTLYLNLENASKNLDKLLIDIEENPSRYIHFSVFGGREKSSKED